MHQNLLSNNHDAQSTTKYGFLLQPNAQIVAVRAHCTHTLRFRRPLGGLKWSGCSVRIWLWLRLPHSCHRHLSNLPMFGGASARGPPWGGGGGERLGGPYFFVLQGGASDMAGGGGYSAPPLLKEKLPRLQGENPEMPFPQCIKTYYQKTMMPKVPQGMGFYYGQTPK